MAAARMCAVAVGHQALCVWLTQKRLQMFDDGFAGEIAGNKDEAGAFVGRAVGGFGPVLEHVGRVEDVLHAVHDERLHLFFDCGDALHAQELVAVGGSECLQGEAQGVAIQRCCVNECKR
jgi:hypothetical protein